MSKIVLPGEPLVEGPTVLRPWRDTDLRAVAEACQDPEIARWTAVPDNYSEADARAFLLYRYDALLAGTTAPFAVVSGSDQLLGSVALMRIDWQHRRGEAGYWLARWGRGQGHATRALKMISGWGFEALGMERIELYAATGNRPSQRVAERAGFVREGVRRAYMRGKDGQQDMVAYALLADNASGAAGAGG
ncbi:MAG TPA: GNAT family N-acetyltransferase [Solirubrobacteraceae bacterium]|nr:GNAT family N-acetyltransferase [Solirubrobacteraceae bacterium]